MHTLRILGFCFWTRRYVLLKCVRASKFSRKGIISSVNVFVLGNTLERRHKDRPPMGHRTHELYGLPLELLKFFGTPMYTNEVGAMLAP